MNEARDEYSSGRKSGYSTGRKMSGMEKAQKGSRSYEDIIRLAHPVSERHPQMPLQARAAQFSPFAALTGHEDAIRETARLTEEFRELDEDSRELLDNKIRFIMENLGAHPEVEITYFQPDTRKSGGAYVTVRGRVERIDVPSSRLIFTDRTVLALDKIRSIDGDMFGACE